MRQDLPVVTGIIPDFVGARGSPALPPVQVPARPRHGQPLMLLRLNLFSTLLLTPLLFIFSVHTAKHLGEIFLLVAVMTNVIYAASAFLNQFVSRHLVGPIATYILLSLIVVMLVVFGSRSLLNPTWLGPFRNVAAINVILIAFYGMAMYLLDANRTKMLTANERVVEVEEKRSGMEIQVHGLEAERDALIVERTGLRIEHSDAKLATLQATLKSHFIFNTLNAIVTLIHDDPQKAEQATLGLARVLRAILEMHDRPLIPLRSEIGILREYVQIERVRLGTRMVFSVDAREDALDILVPSMILQPLVENAIQHGIRQRREGGAIQLRAFSKGERLHLEVVDDGPGISMYAGNGQALSLIRQRLANLYEDQSELTLERDPAKQETIVSVIIPAVPLRCA
jgi:sensor histidine kinase YesM